MVDAPPSPHSRVRSRLLLCLSVLIASVAGYLTWDNWHSGQPVALPDAAHEKLECASYTPSHDGHTLSVDTQHQLVRSDLAILAQRFRCVRTYSVAPGLDDVPKIARELNLKVMLGMWISSHGPSNDIEIARGIELANTYSDVVTAVIVGNEVLLRREQTAAQLKALIERVRAGTQVPVTYADVWEFWMRNPELARSTSFVTVHILPYWEDHPIGIDHALDHVRSIYAKVKEAFPDQRVVIGETGWPSAGRPRLTAVPGLINEARFIREFVAFADREQIPYNLIEAFDQPWKRVQEGTVGGFWGLYDANGLPKFPFIGPVAANPQWLSAWFAALAGAVLFVGGSALLRPKPSFAAWSYAATAGYVAGFVAFSQWQYAVAANRTTLEWIASALCASVGWFAVLLVCHKSLQWAQGKPSTLRASSIASILQATHREVGAHHSDRTLGILRMLVLSCMAYVCFGLVYEGRGRDFPIVFFILPAVGYVLLDALARFDAKPHTERHLDNEELLLGLCIGLSGVIVIGRETWVNSRAVCWGALCLLVGLNLCYSFWRRSTHPNERTEQNAEPAQFERV